MGPTRQNGSKREVQFMQISEQEGRIAVHYCESALKLQCSEDIKATIRHIASDYEHAFGSPPAWNMEEDRFHEIADIVTAETGVDLAQLVGPSRMISISRARQCLMYAAREHLCMTFVRIGELVRRDHAAVIWGHKRFRETTVKEEIRMRDAVMRRIDFIAKGEIDEKSLDSY